MSKKHLGLIGIITLALVICAAMIAGYITFAYKLHNTNIQPQQTQQTQPTPRITYNADYYQVDGQAERMYQAQKQVRSPTVNYHDNEYHGLSLPGGDRS